MIERVKPVGWRMWLKTLPSVWRSQIQFPDRFIKAVFGEALRRTDGSRHSLYASGQGWKKSIVIDIRYRYSLPFVYRMH